MCNTVNVNWDLAPDEVTVSHIPLVIMNWETTAVDAFVRFPIKWKSTGFENLQPPTRKMKRRKIKKESSRLISKKLQQFIFM